MRASFLAVLTLVLVLSGCGGSNGSTDGSRAAPLVASTSTTAPAPSGPYGAMSIARTANGFTLTGEVPDESFKTELPNTLRQAMPGAKIADDLTVKPGVTGPEVAGLGALFGAAMDVKGFAVKLADGTATLTGTADTEPLKAAAASAVTSAWPNVTVVNDIRVGSGECAVAKTPITFATDGYALAPAGRRAVAQIADAVKACKGVTVAVVGYTDDTGGDAINGPLSVNRAKAVADALVSAGVPASEVTSRGAGAANPVADNGTAAGRAQNRRVEMTVS